MAKSRKKSRKNRQQETPKQQLAESLSISWKPYLIIVILGAVIYGQCIGFDFTRFDDRKIIVEQKEEIQGLDKIPYAFTRGFGNFYRPVLRISFTVDSTIAGEDPAMFHFSNIVFHLIASCLIFLTLVRLKTSRPGALFLALLFTAHPVLTEAVAWIPGRNDSLSAIFILLSFISFIKIYDTGKFTHIIMHLLLFAAAMFTKEIAAAFPLAAMLYLVLIRREKVFNSKMLILIPFWCLIILLWFFLRSNAMAGVTSTDVVGIDSFVANLPALPAIIGKTVLPYGYSGLAVFESFPIAAGILALAVLIIFIITNKSDGKQAVLFGLLWFLIFLLPTFIVRMENAADYFDYLEHRAYVPMLGMLIVFAGIFKSTGASFTEKKKAVSFELVIIVAALLAFINAGSYRNPETFWGKAIDSNPERANFHSVMGKIHYERKELQKAKKYFRSAVELTKTNDASYFNNLAVVHLDLKDYPNAIAMSRKAIEYDTTVTDYKYILGKSLYRGGKPKEARLVLEEVVRLDEKQTDAWILLIAIYAMDGEIDKAISACQSILDYDENNFHAHNILGSLYLEKQNYTEAEKMLLKASSLKPRNLQIYEQLARCYIATGQTDKAKSAAGEIIKHGGQVPEELIKNIKNIDKGK